MLIATNVLLIDLFKLFWLYWYNQNNLAWLIGKEFYDKFFPTITEYFLGVCMCVCVCVCVCVYVCVLCVFTSIYCEVLIFLKQLEWQWTDQRHVEDVSFLRQVPSSLL